MPGSVRDESCTFEPGSQDLGSKSGREVEIAFLDGLCSDGDGDSDGACAAASDESRDMLLATDVRRLRDKGC
jgi:hypothetical protein